MEENITNKVLELKNGDKYLILRQARYKGNTYYYAAKLNEDETDCTDEFIFLEKSVKDGKSFVKTVTDEDTLKVLVKNVKIDE